MKFSSAEQGRVFIIRLEDGDVIHTELEKFALKMSIQRAALIILGGADKDSSLIVGPAEGRSATINPMKHILGNVHEVTGTGTIFPDKDNKPVLHMHLACGRNEQTITGCVREGVKTWHILEVILFELLESNSRRLEDKSTGFSLLVP